MEKYWIYQSLWNEKKNYKFEIVHLLKAYNNEWHFHACTTKKLITEESINEINNFHVQLSNIGCRISLLTH